MAKRSPMKMSAKNQRLLMVAAGLVAVGVVVYMYRDTIKRWFGRESYTRTDENQQHMFKRGRADYLSNPEQFPHDQKGDSHLRAVDESQIDFYDKAEEVHSGEYMDKYDQYGVCTQGEHIVNDSKTRFDLINAGEPALAAHLAETGSVGDQTLSGYEMDAHRMHANHSGI